MYCTTRSSIALPILLVPQKRIIPARISTYECLKYPNLPIRASQRTKTHLCAVALPISPDLRSRPTQISRSVCSEAQNRTCVQHECMPMMLYERSRMVGVRAFLLVADPAQALQSDLLQPAHADVILNSSSMSPTSQHPPCFFSLRKPPKKAILTAARIQTATAASINQLAKFMRSPIELVSMPSCYL